MNEPEIPSELKYTKTHEWVRREMDDTFVIGITHHAQSLLGDLVHVELPELSAELKAGDEAGVVESVKAASDIYSPMSGEVIKVNEELLTHSELLNQDPYGNGWIMQITALDPHEYEELLSAADYKVHVDAESH